MAPGSLPSQDTTAVSTPKHVVGGDNTNLITQTTPPTTSTTTTNTNVQQITTSSHSNTTMTPDVKTKLLTLTTKPTINTQQIKKTTLDNNQDNNKSSPGSCSLGRPKGPKTRPGIKVLQKDRSKALGHSLSSWLSPPVTQPPARPPDPDLGQVVQDSDPRATAETLKTRSSPLSPDCSRPHLKTPTSDVSAPTQPPEFVVDNQRYDQPEVNISTVAVAVPVIASMDPDLTSTPGYHEEDVDPAAAGSQKVKV